LYELYYNEVGPEELALPPRQPLANFQLDAVKQGLGMIEAYGGCYIGDVVGLGKTFIGAELLRQLRNSYPNEGNPLILCPAGLIPMWRRMNEEFGLGAEVVSHSMITSDPDPEFDEELGQYVEGPPPGQGIVLQREYANRGPVLVDEAHNFRNVNMRSKGLRDYLEAGNHKVVLMSATPQNLGPMDIYRQINLFLDERDHGLNIEPASLEQYFSNAQRWIAYRADYENYERQVEEWERAGSKGPTPSRPSRPNVPRAEVQEVLTPVFIRRRRRDIHELFGNSAQIDGKPVEFPETVLGNVEYHLDKVYAKAGSLDEIEALLRKHKAYRYRATKYIKDEVRDRPEYRDLFRAQDRIARLMAALLLKRLESSIEAFRSTLNSLMRSNRNFKEALEAGFVPIGSTATRMLGGEGFEADTLLSVLQQEEVRRQETGQRRSKLVHNVTDFKIDEWIPELDADYEVLSTILNKVKDISPEDDDKLRVLQDFLDRPDVKSGKVLIFSEAETTIDYLYEQLNPEGRNPTIVRLTGSTGADTENVVRRFSPNSNPARGRRLTGPEIRILLATDVVSEGQNLQDCARVLNYDLHWNPVKLIQRFGRVDRIGTEHQTINLHNMWPDRDVDAELDLTERLRRRVQSFHDLIGLDSKLLHESERLNLEAMYRIYGSQEMPDEDDGLDEVAANQLAAGRLQRIQDEQPDLWRTITELPDGIRSALRVITAPSDNDPSPFDAPRRGETIALFSSNGVRACYAIDDSLTPRAISPAQFVAAAECAPDTPVEVLLPKTNERVMAAFETFRSEFRQRLGQVRRPRDTRTRRYINRELNLSRGLTANDPDKTRQNDDLRRIFADFHTPQVENALTEIRTIQLEGDALLVRLQALRERYRLSPVDAATQEQPVNAHIVRIVCSDGLV
ncbi:MAG: DEAD/DEAH box helicase, partial [Chloroflexi bacterium]|nr:DEAD/DEAH box helicase [Chloroflexota bacterium]